MLEARRQDAASKPGEEARKESRRVDEKRATKNVTVGLRKETKDGQKDG